MKTVVILLAMVLQGASTGAEQLPVDTHKEAATELLSLMNLEKTMAGAAAAMTDAMIQGNAILAPYREVILQWARGFMTWETFGPRYVALYTEAFTESELREMIAFYKTPTGQKVLTLMPELMQRGSKIGADVAQEHSAELQEMLRKRAAELQKQSTQP